MTASKISKVIHGQHCEYCDVPTVYIKTKDLYIREGYPEAQAELYGKRTFWSKTCPSCGAYVGCHMQGKVPKGRVANKALRMKKTEAHNYFDYLWKTKTKVTNGNSIQIRLDAYTWLAEQMGLPVKLTHIGMFSMKQCQKVIDICKPIALAVQEKTNEPILGQYN